MVSKHLDVFEIVEVSRRRTDVCIDIFNLRRQNQLFFDTIYKK